MLSSYSRPTGIVNCVVIEPCTVLFVGLKAIVTRITFPVELQRKDLQCVIMLGCCMGALVYSFGHVAPVDPISKAADEDWQCSVVHVVLVATERFILAVTCEW